MDLLKTLVNVVLVFFFGTEPGSILTAMLSVLYFAGLWGIFRKCGLKGWHAVVPCLREYDVGRAAGMEKEGRVAAVLQGALVLLNEVTALLPGDINLINLSGLTLIVTTILALVLFVYMVRIELSLCEVFGQKKRWVLLWVALSFIPAS